MRHILKHLTYILFEKSANQTKKQSNQLNDIKFTEIYFSPRYGFH